MSSKFVAGGGQPIGKSAAMENRKEAEVTRITKQENEKCGGIMQEQQNKWVEEMKNKNKSKNKKEKEEQKKMKDNKNDDEKVIRYNNAYETHQSNTNNLLDTKKEDITKPQRFSYHEEGSSQSGYNLLVPYCTVTRTPTQGIPSTIRQKLSIWFSEQSVR